MPGLIEASQVAQEAEDDAAVASGKPAAKVAEHRATKDRRRMERVIAHLAKHPELHAELQRASDAWVCASVVAIGIAADDVQPGTYATAPATVEGGAFEVGRFSMSEDEDADTLFVGSLVADERRAIATAAQRHGSARERLRPVGAATRAPAGV
jgi:hypothetical protein